MSEKITVGMSDKAIVKELWARIEAKRLERNISQEELAAEFGMSDRTYRRMISEGGGKLESFVGALRCLSGLGSLDALLPESELKPLELMSGKPLKVRQKASGSRAGKPGEEDDLGW